MFASGQIGAAPDGKLPDSIEEQSKLAMDNIGHALSLAGTDFAHVVKCTVMLEDMGQWQSFNRVYITYFEPGRLPARSAFGTNGLALSAKVEVECMAYHPMAQH